MDKNKLIEIKKRLLTLGLAGVMIGTAGCTSNKDEKGVPKNFSISSEYSNVDDYYKYVMQNGEAVKLYNSANVYLLFNKETYEVSEYIYYRRNILGGLGSHVELYDLPNENMIVYSGISTTYNEEYYKYLIENNYQVCLTEASDYVEGHTGKEYYSLDEIKELEPQIAESLKIINSAKVKTK
mgnify:CR=1 FL=1